MHPVRFLLVDDLEENLLSLEALLRRENLVLLKARSGDEALELLLQHDVALALVDVQMPGLNGFELAELMRGNERTRHIPIIFVTAGTADGQRRFRGYEAGAVDGGDQKTGRDRNRFRDIVVLAQHTVGGAAATLAENTDEPGGLF